MHLAYIWIVSHLSAKNYRNLWKFDEVLTKTNLLSFFWDTVYKQRTGTLAAPAENDAVGVNVLTVDHFPRLRNSLLIVYYL